MALDATGERLVVEELDGLRLVCDPQDSERPTKRLVRLVKPARQLGGLPAAVQVRLLCGPGCPLVDDARAVLARALRRIDVPVEIEEIEGEFASPTLLVDGAM
jgi:hypothetical protein